MRQCDIVRRMGLIFVVLLLMLSLAACGGKKKSETPKTSEQTSQSGASSQAKSEADEAQATIQSSSKIKRHYGWYVVLLVVSGLGLYVSIVVPQLQAARRKKRRRNRPAPSFQQPLDISREGTATQDSWDDLLK